MKTTDIYGLPYIEADDLVSAAPAQFKTMAESIETALAEVDSRNTPAGVKPVIATTLEALAAQTGVTGQTGYVTADTTTANNGPYFWNGSAWLPYATGGMLDDLRNQLTQGYEFGHCVGSSDINGAILISFERAHATAPRTILLTQLHVADAVDLNFTPMVWSRSKDDFQIRLKTRNETWAGAQPFECGWMAIWPVS